MLKTRAGPRDGDKWKQRLKEEYQALIQVSYTYYPNSILIHNIPKTTKYALHT